MKKRKQKKFRIAITPVIPNDMMSVYKLSNQKSVRDSSFHEKIIKLEDHKKWFWKMIENDNVIMIKATMDGKHVGQARLEIGRRNIAQISICTSEKYRKKGIAGRLVKAIIRKARGKKVKSIIANIKPCNIASIKFFEKNGWIFEKRIVVLGTKALKYAYQLKK